MKTILFDFSAMGAANDKAIKEITRRFAKAGVEVVSSSVAPQTTKRAGVVFRNVTFTFADSQTAVLAVKETGDVFEVKINGSMVPLRQQDDHAKTIAEIAALLDKRRVAFQRAMARVKVPLPPSVRATRKTIMAAKVEKRDGLREAVSLAKQALSELTGTPA